VKLAHTPVKCFVIRAASSGVNVDYEALLQQARDHIESTDFTALREASTQEPSYNPYARNPAQKEFSEAVNAADFEGALKIGAAALEQDYLNADLHFGMAYCYEKLGKTAHQQWHEQFAIGLVRSVLLSGDGASPATAFRVLYFREVYDVLRVRRLRLTQQSLLNEPDGQRYDLMQCVAQDGTTVALYFNITAYFGAGF
jgi:hypothetical protein